MGDHDTLELVPLRLETMHVAFLQLGHRVNAAFHTQIGDRLRLQEHNSGVLCFLQAVQEHSDVIPAPEHQVMEESVNNMLVALSTATVQSEGPPSMTAVSVAAPVHAGMHGRPRIEINYDFLSFGLELCGPTGLAPVTDILSRTTMSWTLSSITFLKFFPSLDTG
ncbi:hypothetical protein B0H16DRAFT_1470974 [Mycena metata]|uniref:Uncharacterized protein n=1 Tax=Mycena metata TaxID=1033252 RepID=A0AAD7MQE8_9AGAR|nr:hypothetical protein B0H16DRAFT_1470974 [Mycena metata]